MLQLAVYCSSEGYLHEVWEYETVRHHIVKAVVRFLG